MVRGFGKWRGREGECGGAGDAPAYSSSAAGPVRVLRPEGMRDGDRGGREADKGSVCDCVGDHGGGERHGRACGWNSFACAASDFFFFSFPLCPRASINRLEREEWASYQSRTPLGQLDKVSREDNMG